MNKEAFKQRMQSLKSYREQNPGKGYWDFKSYEEGGEVPPTNKPTIIEPIPYKGKLYSDRYGRKYTEEQVYDYYNNGTVSDTEPQGRRDTHKEEEQRETNSNL